MYKLPVVFVCENNFYASHLSLLERRAKDNIYISAEAHGIPGLALDGNDVVTVYYAALEAVGRARRGDGPTLLECRTYRWRGHVGPAWDMDVGVKRKDELESWVPKDPIARSRVLLLSLGLEPSALNQIDEDLRKEIEETVRFARESSYPREGDLRQHVYCQATGVA